MLATGAKAVVTPFLQQVRDEPTSAVFSIRNKVLYSLFISTGTYPAKQFQYQQRVSLLSTTLILLIDSQPIIRAMRYHSDYMAT